MLDVCYRLVQEVEDEAVGVPGRQRQKKKKKQDGVK